MNAKIREASSILKDLTREIGKVIVGRQYLVDRLIMALLADGHILIEASGPRQDTFRADAFPGD